MHDMADFLSPPPAAVKINDICLISAPTFCIQSSFTESSGSTRSVTEIPTAVAYRWSKYNVHSVGSGADAS
eukprot:5811750-Pleurochrysis_carterae.AAC.1